MAIAKYFAKDLLAINQLLKTNNKSLQDLLLNVRVGICFDENAATTREGRKSLDLVVRLLSRIYPNLAVVDATHQKGERVADLIRLAKSINSSIDVNQDLEGCACLLVVGALSRKLSVVCQTFYVGSDNWIAKLSQSKQQFFQDSHNPFGCGAAACLGAANVFRFIFRQFFPDNPLDNEVEFSTLAFSSKSGLNPKISNLSIDNLILVGVGAIGNGVIWALSNLETLAGTIKLIDHESISLSNLQRYILFKEADLNRPKVEAALEFFRNDKMKIELFSTTWADYLNTTKNWRNDQIAVAIDNKKDRIAIQSSLPKKIFNAYTEENLIGIATHVDFINSACLACGYIPTQKERNYTEEVAFNCNIPQHANFIKDYLNLNVSVDSFYNNNTVSLLDVIATTNGIPRELLSQFHGKKVNEFYSEFVCGGISMSLSSVETNKMTNVDAPLAFQSAMAGILLASRIVSDGLGIANKDLTQQTHLHPLNLLSQYNPFNHNLQKDISGKCLCADPDFIETYKEKWTSQ